MNKIEYKGVKILDIDAINNTIQKTQEQVSSDDIVRIEVVNDYPPVEQTNVLYIKVESNNNNNN